jgi:hypothetical protein
MRDGRLNETLAFDIADARAKIVPSVADVTLERGHSAALTPAAYAGTGSILAKPMELFPNECKRFLELKCSLTGDESVIGSYEIRSRSRIWSMKFKWRLKKTRRHL